MKTRRVVTGHDAAGKPIIVSDTATPRHAVFSAVPGFETSLVWQTEANDNVGGQVVDQATETPTWAPSVAGTKLMVITFPPDSVMANPEFDPMAAGAEYGKYLPGLAEKFEIEAPGMHVTDSVDYGVVLDGEIWLDLDDGNPVHLKRHDIVVQNGTRHAWRNRGDKPATMMVVLVGANRAN